MKIWVYKKEYYLSQDFAGSTLYVEGKYTGTKDAIKLLEIEKRTNSS